MKLLHYSFRGASRGPEGVMPDYETSGTHIIRFALRGL